MYWKERSCEQKLGNTNSFCNFRQRNDSPENFVRQSLANITRVARIHSICHRIVYILHLLKGLTAFIKLYFRFLRKFLSFSATVVDSCLLY